MYFRVLQANLEWCCSVLREDHTHTHTKEKISVCDLLYIIFILSWVAFSIDFRIAFSVASNIDLALLVGRRRCSAKELFSQELFSQGAVQPRRCSARSCSARSVQPGAIRPRICSARELFSQESCSAKELFSQEPFSFLFFPFPFSFCPFLFPFLGSCVHAELYVFFL